MTDISYLDEAINPTAGCTKVSEGCDNCYALRGAWRMSHHPNPKIADRYQGTAAKHIDDRLHWTGKVNLVYGAMAKAIRITGRKRIGVGFMSDLWHPGVTDEFIAGCLVTAKLCRKHDFFFLTKQVERMARTLEFTAKRYGIDFGKSKNLWFGATVESSKHLHRAEKMSRMNVANRWLSLEPLLSELYFDVEPFDWIVIGGESGPGARPMQPDWALEVIDRCRKFEVPVYFKQMSGKAAIPSALNIRMIPNEARVPT